MSKTSRPGIECPVCGHGTYVAKTENYVSWIKRIRTCKNKKCRHTFDTTESRAEAPSNDLFPS